MIKKILEKTIGLYIMEQLGINKNSEVRESLLSKKFFIKNLDLWEDNISSKLYGIEAKVQDIEFNIYCVDLSESMYITLIQLTGLPQYAIYHDDVDTVRIYVKTKDSDWVATNTFVQASMLAGMEQINRSFITFDSTNDKMFNINDLINLIDINEG